MPKARLSDRDNFLRAVEFRGPEWIPLEFDLLEAVVWEHGSGLVGLPQWRSLGKLECQ